MPVQYRPYMAEPRRAPILSDLPVVTPADPPPVYDCHVIFTGPDAEGRLHGRVTNLPDVSATATTERELLTQLVKRFKFAVVECRTQGRPVPWIAERERPGPGEQQRWIPVHL